MEKLTVIVEVLKNALICSIIATNLVNGLKNAINSNSSAFNRILTVVIDIVISVWIYVCILGEKDVMTYIVTLLATCAGAEAIYQMMGSLAEGKTRSEEIFKTPDYSEPNGTDEDLG